MAREGEDGKAAFEFLVEQRHGPMVLAGLHSGLEKTGTRRKYAFQATFLALASARPA